MSYPCVYLSLFVLRNDDCCTPRLSSMFLASHTLLISLDWLLLLLAAFAVGLVLGFLLRSRVVRRSTFGARSTKQRYENQISQLMQIATSFSGDLSKQSEFLDCLEAKLVQTASKDSSSDATKPKAVTLIAEVTAANQRLKKRLQDAEQILVQQKQDLEENRSLAMTDGLTGLQNRRAFEQELSRRWATWERRQVPVSVLMLDIDHFKSINDTHGHDGGDAVLQEVASRLLKALRECDYVARIGGEEIAVLVPDEGMNALCVVSQRILHAIRAEPVRHAGQEIWVTTSCGVMEARGADSPEAMLKGADLALYEAKSNGRNRAYIHEQGKSIQLGECSEPSQALPAISMANKAETPQSQDEGDLQSVADRLRRRLRSLSDPASISNSN